MVDGTGLPWEIIMGAFRRLVVLASVMCVVVAFPAVAAGSHGAGDAIDVCCAWNSALNDGDLTYRISGGTPALQDAARDGAENWDGITAGNTLTLTEVFGNTKADIAIRLKKGGSPFTAGQANRKFERIGVPGFAFFVMKGVNISIFGARPGNAGDVEKTSAHEVGHALGAGHANAAGYLMSPSLAQFNSSTPTQCDIDAVVAAQDWYFSNARLQPPNVDHVAC